MQRTPIVFRKSSRDGAAIAAVAAWLAISALQACGSGRAAAEDESGVETAVDAPTVPLPGTYEGEVAAAAGPGRVVTLSLEPDGKARMVTVYQDEETPAVQDGTWSPAAADRARVTFTRLNERTISETVTFELRGTTLTAVEYDPAQYGSAGLVLERR